MSAALGSEGYLHCFAWYYTRLMCWAQDNCRGHIEHAWMVILGNLVFSIWCLYLWFHTYMRMINLGNWCINFSHFSCAFARAMIPSIGLVSRKADMRYFGAKNRQQEWSSVLWVLIQNFKVITRVLYERICVFDVPPKYLKYMIFSFQLLEIM